MQTLRPLQALATGLALLSSGCLLLTAPAQANELDQATGFYATLGLGASWLNDQSTNYLEPLSAHYTYDGGFSGDAGLGYDFGPIRAELTYAFNSFSSNALESSLGSLEVSGGSTRLNSGYLSAYWDLPVGGRLVPYIGGGVGFSHYSYGSGSLDGVAYPGGSADTFGYQAKAGVSWLVSRQTDAYLEGVYQGGSSFTIAGEDYGAINSWGARLGVRWRFSGAPAAAAAAPAAMPEAAAPISEPTAAPEPAPAPAPIRGLW